MSTPFIRNHQFNIIKKQADFLLKTLRTVADRKVIETVRFSTSEHILQAFSSLTEEEKVMLERVSGLEKAEDFQEYLNGLEPYIEPFPPITLKQIQKLFPKHKKLKVPDLNTLDFRYLTYLSWVDVAANRLFIVYSLNGQFVGMEGRITPTNKKGYCMLCNRHQELAFFTVKTKPASSLPDNIAYMGQYVCEDNHHCNQVITDPGSLEKFILKAQK